MGFTLQFSVTNYINFAYGALLTFGAYVALLVNNDYLHVNVWIALPIAGLATAMLAVVLNRVLFGPFSRKRRQLVYLLVVTVAVSQLLDSVYNLAWGSTFQELSFGGTTVHQVGPFFWATNDIVFMALTCGCMVGLQFILMRTRLGKYMRAISDDQDLARTCGIPTERVIDITWAISGFLAGMAGVFFAIQSGAFSTTVGDTYIFLIVGAVIIGGIGRAYGAVVGAVIVGVSVEVAQLFLPTAISPVLVFVALVVIMVFRPQGLLGATTRPIVED